MTQIIRACAAILSLVIPSAYAVAQPYPNKPVRLIVPFAPGGTTDIVSRIVALKLGEMWGQFVVVDNRGGAGGRIGGELAAKATPDGYTLLMTSGSLVTSSPHMYKMPFDPAKDLVPITNVASGPQVVVVNNNVPAKSVGELIALAKAKPGWVRYGSSGLGSQTHLAAEEFLYTAGVSGLHVPYRSGGLAFISLISGEIQFLMPNIGAAIGPITQGQVRALAVTSAQRVAQLPNVSTVAETLPGFESVGWHGLMAQTGTPKSVIDKVYTDTVRVLHDAKTKKSFENLAMIPVGNSPAEFAKEIRKESESWAKIIRELKLSVN